MKFKSGEDVLEEKVKRCYLGDLFSYCGGIFETLSKRIGSAWKLFRDLGGLSLKQRGKIYQSWVRQVLLYWSKTCRTVADELRQRKVEQRMIRMMCRVRFVDSVLSFS